MYISRRSFLSLAAVPAFLTLSKGENVFAQMVSPDDGVHVHDVYGNALGNRGIGLVHWDGYIANPAVKINLTPPSNISFPAKVNIASMEPRIYFDLPSTVGASGPRKTVSFDNKDSVVPVYLSIFPDRSGIDQDYLLWFQIIDSSGTKRVSNVPIHVFNQDSNTLTPFKVTLDYTYDTVGFFSDPSRKAAVQQSADDWAYFIDDMKLDPVLADNEKLWIFPPQTDFTHASLSPAPFDYRGFLVEMYGVQNSRHQSGGEPSNMTFQKTFGTELPLRCSGNVAFDTEGNWNTLGWQTISNDTNWWRGDNLTEHESDLYSIARHELAHVLFVNSSYPEFDKMKSAGEISSDAILAYHGNPIKVDSNDHFAGELDDASLYPAFGNEYNGKMPAGRWLTTKLDILAAEAVGYKVRKPFDLAVETDCLPGSFYGMKYQAQLKAKGGLPWYRWNIELGELPDGVTLDRDTGIISGVPRTPGSNTFVVSVRDSSEKQGIAISKALNIPAI